MSMPIAGVAHEQEGAVQARHPSANMAADLRWVILLRLQTEPGRNNFDPGARPRSFPHGGCCGT